MMIFATRLNRAMFVFQAPKRRSGNYSRIASETVGLVTILTMRSTAGYLRRSQF